MADPAAVFEALFAGDGWRGLWRDGIYNYLHFHTRTHEVLGIARGRVRIALGGKGGRVLPLKAGDVVVLPAGTGHKRLSRSRDLLVVGAYSLPRKYNEPRPADLPRNRALAEIAKVPVPQKDPVYGANGPLMRHWRI